MRWQRPLSWTLAMVFAATAQGAPQAQEAAQKCRIISQGSEIRFTCADEAAPGDIKVELPDPVPPVTTLGGLPPGFPVTLPEPPPDTIVVLPADLAANAPTAPAEAERPPVIALPMPELPPGPVMPAPEAAPASTASVIQEKSPEPAIPLADVPPMPGEVLKAAVSHLKAGTRLTEADLVSIAAFYEARNHASLWLDNGQWNERAKAVRARLAAAADEGLDPSRYRSVSAFIGTGEPQWHALASAELQLTESVVLFARDVSIGRIAPGLVNALITPKLVRPVALDVLSKLQDSADTSTVLDALSPPHEGYRMLRARLAEVRAERPVVDQEPIPDGPALRVGMRDRRVPLIRARLGLGYDPEPVYDRNVSIKVADLQKSAGLPVTGAFNAQTRRALSGEGPSPDEAEIIANMEFWRWLPRDLGADHIFVNVPAYGLDVRREGNIVHQARVIVGKGSTQTPFFSDMMDHVVVNPSWYVPPGILKKDPRYLDPAWASARGYEIRTRGSITTVRVPPSASNALGYIKFMFPNNHAVYLHDTPSRGLFNAANRTLSNGCVRVENPFQLAALLFASEGWSEERFRKLIGGGERHMKLPRKTPIHLAYFTLTFDPDGKLLRHPDVYGHSAKLRQLLGLS